LLLVGCILAQQAESEDQPGGQERSRLPLRTGFAGRSEDLAAMLRRIQNRRRPQENRRPGDDLVRAVQQALNKGGGLPSFDGSDGRSLARTLASTLARVHSNKSTTSCGGICSSNEQCPEACSCVTFRGLRGRGICVPTGSDEHFTFSVTTIKRNGKFLANNESSILDLNATNDADECLTQCKAEGQAWATGCEWYSDRGECKLHKDQVTGISDNSTNFSWEFTKRGGGDWNATNKVDSINEGYRFLSSVCCEAVQGGTCTLYVEQTINGMSQVNFNSEAESLSKYLKTKYRDDFMNDVTHASASAGLHPVWGWLGISASGGYDNTKQVPKHYIDGEQGLQTAREQLAASVGFNSNLQIAAKGSVTLEGLFPWKTETCLTFKQETVQINGTNTRILNAKSAHGCDKGGECDKAQGNDVKFHF
jgi:hypothetical protein